VICGEKSLRIQVWVLVLKYLWVRVQVTWGCTHAQPYLCTLMTQRFILSHFLVVLGIQALIQNLKKTTLNIRFHLVNWCSLHCVRV
jgi:hypothetical protein